MTAQIVAHAVQFTRHDVDTAAADALTKVTSPVWVRAINRAVDHLQHGQFSFDGHQVILHSATSDQVYRIVVEEPMVCTCKAHERGLVCWHVCAARLIVRAAEHHATHAEAVTLFAKVIPLQSYQALTDSINTDLFAA